MTLVDKAAERLDHLASASAQSAEHAIDSTREVARDTLDRVSGNVEELRHATGAALHEAAEQTGELAQRGVDAVQEGSRQLRREGRRLSAGTVRYVRQEPLKALAIAATAGALLMAWMDRSSRSRG